MRAISILALAAGMLAAQAVVPPAAAQKAKDTLRIGYHEPISTVSLYDDPQPETGLTSRAVFDGLLCFDLRTGEYHPLLARSWRFRDEQTLEIDLKEGIRFHDGSPLDAEDVVYTLNWLIDPATKHRFASNFDWLARAEQTAPHKLVLHTRGPSPLALPRLATGLSVFPSDVHAALNEKGEFGRRTPIGSGPYKVDRIDATRGIVLVKNQDYRHGNDCKPAARVGRIEAIPVPDMQAQIAQLMTGGLDLLRVASKEIVDAVLANPAMTSTVNQAITYHYMTMDSVGRSGNKALADLRVRQALVLAIDRDNIVGKVIPGGSIVAPIDALCFRVQRGCDFATKPPAPDRDMARRLLAEAGYAQGFDVEITVTTGSHEIGEAIGGELRRIGVRARIDRVTFTAYRQKQRDGRLQILIGQWTSGGLPDASSPVDFFFDGASRDYWKDPEILRLKQDGLATIDEVKRRAIYRRIFDRVNEMAYVLPVSTRPDVFLHGRDITIRTGSLSTYGIDAYDIAWQ